MHEVELHGVVPAVEGVLAAAVPVELDQLQAPAAHQHRRTRRHIDLWSTKQSTRSVTCLASRFT